LWIQEQSTDPLDPDKPYVSYKAWNLERCTRTQLLRPCFVPDSDTLIYKLANVSPLYLDDGRQLRQEQTGEDEGREEEEEEEGEKNDEEGEEYN
jgi:hypothetical protein